MLAAAFPEVDIGLHGVSLAFGLTLVAALVCEVVMTFFFLIIILGSTDRRAPAGMAPLAIGLAVTLIHLIRGKGA